MPELVIGTRRSRLALWQTNFVANALQAAWPGLKCHIAEMDTLGDRILDKPLPEIGGKGLFTAELEQALREGHIDIAVHSLKDLPTEDAEGLTLGAILNRADVRDALVSRNGTALADLPTGAIVGTSSNRRKAQLLALRPDLEVRSIRGNVDTRLKKLFDGQYDAIVLAAAGLTRLDLTHHVTEFLTFEQMLPAPGQGALAVQSRQSDTRIQPLLDAIHDEETYRAITAERTFLASLGGGCSAPIAAFAIDNRLRTRVLAQDGSGVVEIDLEKDDPVELGREAAAFAIQEGAEAFLHG